MKKNVFIAGLLSVICMSTACSTDTQSSSQPVSDDISQSVSGEDTVSSETSIEDSVPDKPEENYDALLKVSLKHLTIEDNVVTECSPFASGAIIIPDGVTDIGASAFEGCDGITEIRVPSSVEVIAFESFLDCVALKKLELSEGLLVLYGSAFDGCTNLKEVALPDSLAFVPKNVFGDSNVTLTYKGKAYKNSDAQALCDAVVHYDENGFLIADGNLITTLPSVGGDIVIPDTVKKICDFSFNGNDINTLLVPGSVKEIEENAFWSCGPISEVTLEEGVTTLGDHIFYETSPAIIHLPNSLTDISEYSLRNCRTCEYNGVEYRHYSQGEYGDNNLYELYNILMPEYQDGLLIKDGVLVDFLYCKDSYSEPLVIPEGVTTIGEAAFPKSGYFNTFYAVTLPQSLTEICDEAFMFATIESIEIPAGVKRIGNKAFRGCDRLEEVVLNDGIEEIGENAFEHCKKVNILYKGNNYTLDNINELYKALNG